MKVSISKLRREYKNKPLLEKDLSDDPLKLVRQWLNVAISAHVLEANSVVLATVSAIGNPSTRSVLIKKCDDKGLIFFTNYHSRKGEQLLENPRGAMTFLWRDIVRQINLEGKVKKIPRLESNKYFQSRPRGAQLAAAASAQSQPLASREELEEIFSRLEKKYRGKKIPCPKNWGGYRLIPDRIEFWQGRENRLHDRFLYVLANGEWIFSRLYP